MGRFRKGRDRGKMKNSFDLITADFAYVRWLGDRKGIEKQTTTWDKTVVDRSADLKRWADLLWVLVNSKKIRKIIAYANNHVALCRLTQASRCREGG